MTPATLPAFLSAHACPHLIRVGRDHDGGYAICGDDLKRSDTLIGLGVERDWSFEADFVARNDVPVLAFDASVGRSVFLENVARNLVWPHRPQRFLRDLRTYRAYRRFFTGKRRHIEKFVDLDHGSRYISMDRVFAATDARRLFLKIDIEGSEYRVLDSILAHQDRITGLVVEFHDCDLHLDRIRRFVAALELRVVHVHANNYGPVSPALGIPTLLEITFASCPGGEGASHCAGSPVDMPNDPETPEIVLHTVPGGRGR